MINFYNRIKAKIKAIEEQLRSMLAPGQAVSIKSTLFSFKVVGLNLHLFYLESLENILKFLIILTQNSGDAFNVFFRQKDLNSCPVSYCQFKEVQKKIRVFSTAGATTIVAVSVIVSLTLNLITGALQSASAQAVTWAQADWNEVSASTQATSDATTGVNTPPSGWAGYASKDSEVTAGANITLATAAGSLVQTNDGSTNTGFNLAGASFSSTELNGTAGDGSGVILTSSGVAALTTAKIVSGDSGSFNCALTDAGAVYCWGLGTSGQLGDGLSTTSAVPVQVQDGVATGSDASGGFLANIVNITAGTSHACAVSAGGNIYCWGSASSGVLGNGATTPNQSTPVRVQDGVATGSDSDTTNLINIASVSAGSAHTCAVSNGGNVYCWGNGIYGQLGDSLSTTVSTPVRVQDGVATGSDSDTTNLINIDSVSAGANHTCAVSNGGNIYCWGRASNGDLGNGNSVTSQATPVYVQDGVAVSPDSDATNLINIASVSAGNSYTCAVSVGGNVYCWGYAGSGILGNGATTPDQTTPVRVLAGAAAAADSDTTNLINIASVSTGASHTCAVSNGGNIYCWGSGSSGALGNAVTSGTYSTPVRVQDGVAVSPDGDGTNLINIASVTNGSSFSCAVTTGGVMYCWGGNSSNQLGDNTTTNRSTPIRPFDGTADLSGISQIVSSNSGGNYTCAVTTGGYVYCWGLSTSGKLGDGAIADRDTPVRVLKGAAAAADNDGTNLTNIASIAVGTHHTCAVSVGGNIYCWGAGSYGQLGYTATSPAQQTTPVRVLKGAAVSGDNDGTNLTNIAGIALGTSYSCAISNAGNVYCWGYNGYGNLGDNSVTQRNTPVRVLKGAAVSGDNDGTNLTNTASIEAGNGHICAVSVGGNVYCWGYNGFNNLGDNTITDGYTPVRVYVGAAAAADSDGGVSCGGGACLTNIARVAADQAHTCAVSVGGNAYCWGSNGSGRLGDNSVTQRATPVRVYVGAAAAADSDGGVSCGGGACLTNIARIALGTTHTCAVSVGGNIYCWGAGSSGQLGYTATSPAQQTTPVRVLKGAAASGDNDGTNLTNIAGIATGDLYSCVVSVGGNTYCWGSNTSSKLGDNTTTQRNTPIRQFDTATGNAYMNLVYVSIVYSASGTYTSAPINLPNASWGNLSWTHSGGQTLTMKVRTSSSSSFSSSWCSISSGGAIADVGAGCVTAGDQYIQFQATLSGDTTTTPTLADVTIGYNSYPTSSKTLTSSEYDTGDSSTGLRGFTWTEDATLPSGATVTFSLRASSTQAYLATTDWADFTNATSNCSKAGATVTCAVTALPSWLSDKSGDKWFQYKLTLGSTGQYTSTVSDVGISYATNIQPEVQTVTAVQNSDGTISITYQTRDPDTGDSLNVTPGYITPSFLYSTDGGTNWTGIGSNLSANANTNKAVDDVDWSDTATTSAVWTVKNVLNGTHTNGTFKIKVVVDDNETAHETASSTSANFIMDAQNPDVGALPILVKATTSPASLILDFMDESAMKMKIGLLPDVSDDLTWDDYSATPTLPLGTNPDTVYVQVKDVFDNTTSIYSITTPTSPASINAYDTSNTATSEWRLFLAWSVSALDPLDFGSYRLYRSADGGSTYTLVNTQTDKTINYFMQSSLTEPVIAQGATYSYKVAVMDADGNSSYFSPAIQTIVNGTQDAGEGGGGTPEDLPILSAPSTSNKTTQSVTINWTTDKLSDSTVGYCSPAPCTNFTATQGVASYVSSNPGHSVTVSGLTPDTTYNYKIISQDIYDNTASSTGDGSYSFTTNAGPAISNVSVVDVANSTAQITWNTNTAASGYVYYSITTPPTLASSQGGWATRAISRTVNLTSLTPGTKYYFFVASQDIDENWAYDYNNVNGTNEYYTFTTSYDSSAPEISSVADISPSDTSAVITWRTNEGATSQVEYGTATGVYTSFSTLMTDYDINHSVTLTGLSNRDNYYYRVASTDQSGNTASSTEGTISYDTVAPVISEVAEATVTNTSAVVTWKTDEGATSQVEYGTETGVYPSNTTLVTDYDINHSVNLSGLTRNATYYFKVLSTDASGNTASTTGFFTQAEDATPPVISEVGDSSVNTTSSMITWKTNEGATSQVKYGTAADVYTNTTTLVPEYDLNHSVTLSGLTRNRTYYYRAMSVDASGNIATSSPEGSFVQSEDMTAPVISASSVMATSTIDTAATIIWTTDEAATSQVRYGTASGTYPNTTTLVTDYDINHSVPLIGLTKSTKYYYKVVSSDASDNSASSTEKNFTTLEEQIGASQRVTVVSSGGGGGGGLVGVPESDYNKVKKERDDAKAALTALQKEMEDLKNRILGIAPGDDTDPAALIKIVAAKFVSLAGSLSKSPSLVLQESDIAPAIESLKQLSEFVPPPIMKSVPSIKAESTGVMISWETDKPTNSMIAYASDAEYVATSDKPYPAQTGDFDKLTTNHEVTISNLRPSTFYNFQIQSKGEIGDIVKTRNFTFTTLSQQPKITSPRLSPIDKFSASITWNTDVAANSVVRYTPIRAGKVIEAESETSGKPDYVNKHEVVLKKLNPATTYALEISSTDPFGSVVKQNIASFSTTKDETAPEVTQVRTELTVFPGSANKIQTIIYWKTDEPSTSQVFFEQGIQDTEGKQLGNFTTIDNELTTSHTVVITDWQPGSVYKFRTASKDSSNNESVSKDFTVLTPKKTATVVDIILDNFSKTFGWTKGLGM